MKTKTTDQVATKLGVSKQALITYLCRNPHLKPASRAYKAGALFWTDEEIAAVKKARAWRKTGGPKQQSN